MLSGPKSPLTKSLPELPVRVSESLPPRTPSFPGPPTRFFSPPRGRCSLPPNTQSLPSSPSRVSLPARLKRTSLAPLPRSLSAPLVPFKVSGPLVPILFTARDTPLATTSVAAIIVKRRITRRILPSFPQGGCETPYVYGCDEGSILPGRGQGISHMDYLCMPCGYFWGRTSQNSG